MPSLDASRPAILAALGAQGGLPPSARRGADPFEAVLAVALDRALEPRQVARALDALRDAGLLEPAPMAEADPSEVEDALRQAGLKQPGKLAAPLRKLARWVVDRHHGDPEALADPGLSTGRLREELLGLNGVGPATADAILLFGLDRPAYPVDRATYRIFLRHGWLDPTADYEEARSTIERLGSDDPEALARLSAGFERIGRDFCRASVAKCERCPLRETLPEGGPIEPEG